LGIIFDRSAKRFTIHLGHLHVNDGNFVWIAPVKGFF
jgi:hypothetical protein